MNRNIPSRQARCNECHSKNIVGNFEEYNCLDCGHVNYVQIKKEQEAYMHERPEERIKIKQLNHREILNQVKSGSTICPKCQSSKIDYNFKNKDVRQCNECDYLWIA